MNFVLTASRLMKAGEVKQLCAELKKDSKVMSKQESLVREALYRKQQTAIFIVKSQRKTG